jgi:hypothetical protein
MLPSALSFWFVHGILTNISTEVFTGDNKQLTPETYNIRELSAQKAKIINL